MYFGKKIRNDVPFRPNQICSKICPKCFQEFPKNFTYACLSCQQLVALS